MSEKDEAFLGRWSRRKRAGGAGRGGEAPAEQRPVAPDASAEEASEAATSKTPDEVTADLPDIDSLDKDSDFTPFLREGVPEHLKNLALRKLWRSNPVFANLDRLNDYDDDYTQMFTAAVAKTVKTVFKVGKGVAEPDEEAAEAAGATPADDGAAVPEDGAVVADDDRTAKGQPTEDDSPKEGEAPAATPDKPA